MCLLVGTPDSCKMPMWGLCCIIHCKMLRHMPPPSVSSLLAQSGIQVASLSSYSAHDHTNKASTRRGVGGIMMRECVCPFISVFYSGRRVEVIKPWHHYNERSPLIEIRWGSGGLRGNCTSQFSYWGGVVLISVETECPSDKVQPASGSSAPQGSPSIGSHCGGGSRVRTAYLKWVWDQEGVLKHMIRQRFIAEGTQGMLWALSCWQHSGFGEYLPLAELLYSFYSYV